MATTEKVATEKTRRVTIHSTQDDSGDVKLGVNGRLMLVQRNTPVDLPEAFFEVLKNARIETIAKDPDTGRESIITMQRYPYSAD